MFQISRCDPENIEEIDLSSRRMPFLQPLLQAELHLKLALTRVSELCFSNESVCISLLLWNRGSELSATAYLSRAVNNQFILIFLFSEADIILAFIDFRGITIDVHEYLAVVLACKNALFQGMPKSIIFKLSLILFTSFLSYLLVSLPFGELQLQSTLSITDSSESPGWVTVRWLDVVQTREFTKFVPAGKWVLFTRSLCPSGEKMHSGFFFTSRYFVLVSRTQKCELQMLASLDQTQHREVPANAQRVAHAVWRRRGESLIWRCWCTVQN